MRAFNFKLALLLLLVASATAVVARLDGLVVPHHYTATGGGVVVPHHCTATAAAATAAAAAAAAAVVVTPLPVQSNGFGLSFNKCSITAVEIFRVISNEQSFRRFAKSREFIACRFLDLRDCVGDAYTPFHKV